jgi:hypothetical protein
VSSIGVSWNRRDDLGYRSHSSLWGKECGLSESLESGGRSLRCLEDSLGEGRLADILAIIECKIGFLATSTKYEVER